MVTDGAFGCIGGFSLAAGAWLSVGDAQPQCGALLPLRSAPYTVQLPPFRFRSSDSAHEGYQVALLAARWPQVIAASLAVIGA